MAKTKQKMRYSDDELSLIKNTFAENDDLLEALRKVFLQMPLDAIDQKWIENVKKNPALAAVIRKAFLPTLDAKAPRHQLVDLYLTVDIKDKNVDDAYAVLVSRKTLIAYLEQQLSILEGANPINPISLDDLADITGKEPLNATADMVARNTMVGHTEMQLQQFTMLAGTKKETVEETKERLGRDSAK